MFCPKCGKINPDDNEACSGCGAELAEEKASVPEKKKEKALKTILAVIAIIVVVCIVILILNGCGTALPPEEKMTF